MKTIGKAIIFIGQPVITTLFFNKDNLAVDLQ